MHHKSIGLAHLSNFRHGRPATDIEGPISKGIEAGIMVEGLPLCLLFTTTEYIAWN